MTATYDNLNALVSKYGRTPAALMMPTYGTITLANGRTQAIRINGFIIAGRELPNSAYRQIGRLNFPMYTPPPAPKPAAPPPVPATAQPGH